MKTLEDLIDKLNETNEKEGIYYLSEKHKGMFTVDYKLINESWSIAIFDKLNKKILLTTNKMTLNWKEMYWISKYALEHPYKDWFPEKKYNIIIGQDDEDDEIVVDGIQMTKAQADQLYEYFTKKQAENLNKEMNRLKDHFKKVSDIWNM